MRFGWLVVLADWWVDWFCSLVLVGRLVGGCGGTEVRLVVIGSVDRLVGWFWLFGLVGVFGWLVWLV